MNLRQSNLSDRPVEMQLKFRAQIYFIARKSKAICYIGIEAAGKES